MFMSSFHLLLFLFLYIFFFIFSLYTSKSVNSSHRSRAMALKKNGKSPTTSADSHPVMLFRDISLGPHEAELRFRLVHFLEARNPLNKLLIGLEMLLIDEHGTAIHDFILAGRVDKYLPRMKAGALYSLNNFYGSKSKDVFWVADHSVTVSFSWNSLMSPLENSPLIFDEDRYRFHSAVEFESNCDLKGDLYGRFAAGRFAAGRLQNLILPSVATAVFLPT